MRGAGAAATREHAFCDPPYSFNGWADLLGLLVAVAAVAVLESGEDLDPGAGWQVVRVRRYGGTFVTVVRSSAGPLADPELKGVT
jgi:hypothetical protein